MAFLAKALERRHTQKFKYQYDVVIHEVSGLPPLAEGIPMLVNWTRGTRAALTQVRPVQGGVLKFDQPLSLLVTLYKDTKKNVFLEKSSKFALREIQHKRVIGTAALDLAPFADITSKTQSVSLPLDKQKYPPMLRLTITTTWLKDAPVDGHSEMTDLTQITLNTDNATHVDNVADRLRDFDDDDAVLAKHSKPVSVAAPAPAGPSGAAAVQAGPSPQVLQLQASLLERESEATRLREEVQNLNGDIERWRKKCEQLVDKFDKYRTLDDAITSKESEITLENHRIQEAREEIARLEARMEQLRVDLQAKQNQVDDAHARAEEAVAKAVREQSELELLSGKKAQLVAEVGDLNEQVDRLRQQQVEVAKKASSAAATAQLSGVISEQTVLIRSLRTELEALQSEMSSLRDENSELQRQNAALQREKGEMNVAMVAREKAAIDARTASMEARLEAAILEERKRQSAELAHLREEIDRLTAELESRAPDSDPSPSRAPVARRMTNSGPRPGSLLASAFSGSNKAVAGIDVPNVIDAMEAFGGVGGAAANGGSGASGGAGKQRGAGSAVVSPSAQRSDAAGPASAAASGAAAAAAAAAAGLAGDGSLGGSAATESALAAARADGESAAKAAYALAEAKLREDISFLEQAVLAARMGWAQSENDKIELYNRAKQLKAQLNKVQSERMVIAARMSKLELEAAKAAASAAPSGKSKK